MSIALLELRDALVFSDNIRPICVPNPEYEPARSVCFATGWGSTKREDPGVLGDEDMEVSANLQQVQMQIVHGKSV